MKDIAIFENGDGGNLFIDNNDIQSVEILTQQIYLSLFGGNVEASTKGNELENEKRFDWWANSLLFNNQRNRQFNSETEKILNTVVLNSSGRIAIERAVNEDLIHLKGIISFVVSVVIPKQDRVDILIKLNARENQEEKTLQFLWDNLKKEVIIHKEV